MRGWPEWWEYEIVLSPHLMERMQDRNFSETALRTMLSDATDFQPSAAPGRFIIATRHDRAPWEVIVEPDEFDQVLIVVSAYRVE